AASLTDTQEIAYNKIGFHTGPSGNLNGISDYFQKLDSAGVPIFIKAVDDAGPIYEVQELGKVSGVDHIMVFRRTGGSFELPNYDNDPIQEADIVYDRLVSAWPPELDPTKVWMETINEPDKNRSEWLAEFSLAFAKLAVADGRRTAMFAWSSGEPEVEHWEGEKMLEFLAYAAEHKDLVAVSLHEYSYEREEIMRFYPFLVGRFQALFNVVDQRGIGRPTILITEWGWEFRKVPEVEAAMEDIEWASKLYAAYPEILGASIWYLGGGYGSIDDLTNNLLEPVGGYSVTTYFGVTKGIGKIDDSLFYDPNFHTRQYETQSVEEIVQTARAERRSFPH
ncbi:MAG: hypothetical protein AAGD96_28745, partial [Chloroflexota bacterium]